jgi:hypothetical protein
MKLQSYIVLVLLIFIGCDEPMQEPIETEVSLMVGKWQLTEAYISSGGPQYWVVVQFSKVQIRDS